MKTIICIIGPIGSGKDTAAEFISQKLGVPIFQISQQLKDFAKERGIEPTRENLIKIGSNLAKENGPGFFVKAIVDKVSENSIIITGIRMMSVLEYIRQNYDLVLLSIIAEPEIRFERCKVRNKLGEARTLEEFIENEQKENSAPNVQRLFECMDLADYTIANDSDIESFFIKVDKFLAEKNFTQK